MFTFMRTTTENHSTLAAMQGPWASPSLVVACMTWFGILDGCLAVKFDSCNNLLSSVQTLLTGTSKHSAVCQIVY